MATNKLAGKSIFLASQQRQKGHLSPLAMGVVPVSRCYPGSTLLNIVSTKQTMQDVYRKAPQNMRELTVSVIEYKN